jgi:DNA-binding transcriptional ArsR family regulator
MVAKRPCQVSELQQHLGISLANWSQHLAVLKAAGVVGTRRKGRYVQCYLAIPEVKAACALISDMLRAQVKNEQRLGI